MARIFTIGHSNKPIGHLIKRLEQHHIVVVVDVRSKPYSRYNPQYNREPLAESLRLTGRPYVFSGHSLGGKPEDVSLLDSDGNPDYDKIRTTEAYQKELMSIVRGVKDNPLGPLAIMCSEMDPTKCHRRLLVGADFVTHGIELVHILDDGSLLPEQEIRGVEGLDSPSVFDFFGKS